MSLAGTKSSRPGAATSDATASVWQPAERGRRRCTSAVHAEYWMQHCCCWWQTRRLDEIGWRTTRLGVLLARTSWSMQAFR